MTQDRTRTDWEPGGELSDQDFAFWFQMLASEAGRTADRSLADGSSHSPLTATAAPRGSLSVNGVDWLR